MEKETEPRVCRTTNWITSTAAHRRTKEAARTRPATRSTSSQGIRTTARATTPNRRQWSRASRVCKEGRKPRSFLPPHAERRPDGGARRSSSGNGFRQLVRGGKWRMTAARCAVSFEGASGCGHLGHTTTVGSTQNDKGNRATPPLGRGTGSRPRWQDHPSQGERRRQYP